MLLFLFGKDSYRSQQKLRDIISRYQQIHQSGLNLLKFQAEDFNLVKFQDQVQSVSMFAEKKLAVCYEFLRELNQGAQEKLLSFLKAGKIKDKQEMILVFYESNLPDKKLKLFQFLKRKPSQWQEFTELSGAALEQWIRQEAKQQGLKIDNLAVKKLAANVGADLWQMSNEIAKLAAYVLVPSKSPLVKGRTRETLSFSKGGIGGIIQASDVDLFIQAKFQPSIFKTIDALADGNKKTALRLLYQHLETGEDPLYILSMFVYAWRNLLQIKDLLTRRLPYYALAKKTKMHAFVIRKTYHQAQRFSLENLKRNYQYWQALDWQVKTGQINSREALVSAVLSV